MEILEKETLNLVAEPESESSLDDMEWLTAGRIATRIGKSIDWVNLRLKKYVDLIEMRPDSRNHMRPNYPPFVIAALEAEVQKIASLPVVSERDISLNGLSVVLGRDEKWIAARMPFLEIVGEEKLNLVNNRPFTYFDVETDLPALEAEDARMRAYPVANEGESTVEGIADLMSTERRAIVRRLRYVPAIPVLKMHPVTGQLNLFYNTEQIIGQLNDVSTQVKAFQRRHPSERPVEHPIVKLNTGVTSENWGDSALCAEIDPELFTDISNARKVRIAKKFCGSCAARLFCLDYAVANNETDGIWGGLTPKERKRLKLAS